MPFLSMKWQKRDIICIPTDQWLYNYETLYFAFFFSIKMTKGDKHAFQMINSDKIFEGCVVG